MTLREIYQLGKKQAQSGEIGAYCTGFDVLCLFEHCFGLDRQGLIIFIPEDEMIKTTAKLDNIMEYKILNKENYARIMETLGETHE